MQVKKEYKMYCGHRNQELQDKCFRPHGHDYKIFCFFNVKRNGSISTLFGDFDSKVEVMLKEEFDHRFLLDENDSLTTTFAEHEMLHNIDLGYKLLPFPTSVENISYYLFNEIVTRFGFDLERIELQETRTSTIVYTKEDYAEDLKSNPI